MNHDDDARDDVPNDLRPLLLRGSGPPLSPSENPATLYLATLTPGSRGTMASALRAVSGRWFGGMAPDRVPWHELRYVHVQAIRGWLGEHYAVRSANKMLSAVRGCLREAALAGLISEADYRRIESVGRVRGESVTAGRALKQAELRALFECCDRTTALGSRDAAMVALLYGCGLRGNELVRLDVGHYQADTGALLVHGKGRKQRVVYMPPGTRTALDRWLEWRGFAPGPMFCPRSRARGLAVGKRLSKGCVFELVARLGRRAAGR